MLSAHCQLDGGWRQSQPKSVHTVPEVQMWYKGARASSGTCGTVSTVVGCGVLYLFSEASEMKDAKLLGIGVKALSSKNPLSQIATVHNSHIRNNNQKR